MTLSKKHYIAIAKIVNDWITFYEHPDRIQNYRDALTSARILAKDLSDYFEKDNPNFDSKRFLNACGIQLSNEDKEGKAA